MTRRALLFPVCALAATLACSAADSQPSAAWLKRTREHLDLLLGPRRDTSPPPTALPNPFQLPGRPEPANPKESPPAPKASDEETLARLAATLKINGLVAIGGVPQVIINQLSYKEGDLVAVREGDQATYLRVVHIAPAAVTLELNKVEQVVHLK